MFRRRHKPLYVDPKEVKMTKQLIDGGVRITIEVMFEKVPKADLRAIDMMNYLGHLLSKGDLE